MAASVRYQTARYERVTVWQRGASRSSLASFKSSTIRMLASKFIVAVLFSFVASCLGEAPDAGYSHEQLQPLASHRQQHRKTIDGRLCAAAFVQSRQVHTGCTDAPNPAGASGREWCYVEPQLLSDATSGLSPWNYCTQVVDYDAFRVAARGVLESKVGEVRGYVSKLQKAQRAAEEALDMYEKSCAGR